MNKLSERIAGTESECLIPDVQKLEQEIENLKRKRDHLMLHTEGLIKAIEEIRKQKNKYADALDRACALLKLVLDKEDVCNPMYWYTRGNFHE